ncbi:MAG: DUF2141 domain-containing protein [Woeseiaceae bacterium]|nr:DUF2141 domain-containing protein [Woeseiaceae bacterium]
MNDDSGPKAKTSITAGLFVLALFGSTAYAVDLTVKVAKVSSDSGNIRIALHDGEEGFPSKREPTQVRLVQADASGVTVVFNDVVPGTYAVAVYHDVDGDGELDTNFLGAPREPLGFSRDARGRMGPPSFDSAAILIAEDNMEITINLSD